MSKAEELAEALRTGDRSGIWYSGMEAAAELRRLQAENDALRKDAERYRWLRVADPDNETPYITRSLVNSWGNSYHTVELEEEADSAIDSAMKAKQ